METARRVGYVQMRVWPGPGMPASGSGLRRSAAAGQLCRQCPDGEQAGADGGEGRAK